MTIERNKVVSDLVESFQQRGHDVDENTLLFDAGALDSLDALELIEQVEQDYGISVPQSEIVLENISSISQVADMVTRLSAAAK
jgi:acyl carrier protein